MPSASPAGCCARLGSARPTRWRWSTSGGSTPRSAPRGAALRDAAAAVDAGAADGAAGALLALRVRQVVADAAETVLGTVEHALGPGPLALEPDHAARVADLRLYLRQHHAERDTAALGGAAGRTLPDDGRGW